MVRSICQTGVVSVNVSDITKQLGTKNRSSVRGVKDTIKCRSQINCNYTKERSIEVAVVRIIDEWFASG